jgi:5'-3' exonuclease
MMIKKLKFNFYYVIIFYFIINTFTMGSKGFWSFFASIIKKIPLSEFKGKPLFIDVMLYIYKFIIGIRNSGSDIKLKSGKNVTHLYAIYNLVKNYTNEDILPIFVFDGNSPEIKKKEVEKRRNDVIKAQKILDELEEQNDKNEEICENNVNEDNERNENNEDTNEKENYIKNFKRSFTLNTNMINECKMFLDLLGIPYCTAFEEADSQCAVLSHYYSNITNGVVSEDSDVMIFGSPILIRDIDFKSSNKYCNVIYLNDIMTYLQTKTNEIRAELNLEQIIFTKENFIDFTIILGNDYNHGIRCAGGNNREFLFKLFVKNDFKIENFIGYLYNVNKKLNKIKFYIPENFIEKILNARVNYNFASVYNPIDININMCKPEFEKIKKFMIENEFTVNQSSLLSKSISNIYKIYHVSDKCQNKDNVINDWIMVSRKK